MSEYPRRRRLEPQSPPPKRGLPLLPIAIVVLLAGLLIGGGIGKLLNHSHAAATPQPSFTPLPTAAAHVATATPQALARTTPHATPTPRTTSTPSASPQATSATATPSHAPRATARPALASHRPQSTPTPLIVTPTPVITEPPTATPVPTPQSTATPETLYGPANAAHARAIGRSYVLALIRGDESTAAGYLVRGLPTETMLGGGTLQTMDVSPGANGSYLVNANVSTPTGPYYVTMHVVVTAAGMQIDEHSAVKG